MMSQKQLTSSGDGDGQHPHWMVVRQIPQYAYVLELGCSNGGLSGLFKEACQAKVIGIDKDAQAVWRAQRHCDYVFQQDLNDPHSLDALEYERFDVVTLLDVFARLDNPLKLLQTIKPLLLDEGRIIFSVPNIAHTLMRLELLCGKLSSQHPALFRQHHFSGYTLESLNNLLNEAQYKVLNVDCVWQEVPDATIRYHLEQMNLDASLDSLEHFHAPDAVASQFIITAQPCESNESGITNEWQEPLKALLSSNQAWKHLQEGLSHQQQIIRGLELELASCRDQTKSLQESLADKEKALSAIQESRSWKLLQKAEMLLHPNVAHKTTST